jgi:muramoyltetrapeptide carboxypeptidase
MLRPPSLNSGDEIRILTTARKVVQEEIVEAIAWAENLGFKVTLGTTMTQSDHQYGGTDGQRADDFQAALDDPNVKAIWFARGGYGSIRIFDMINWDTFIQNPKWLIGFSDITIWHNLVNQFYGIQTLHTLMPITFPTSTEISKELLAKNIKGEFPSIEFNSNPSNHNLKSFEGEIIGGNLSILYSLLGTKSGFNSNGKILFIEEIDEYLYHIDRMMISLKNAGKLSGLKGMIVGGFTDIRDNTIPFGKTYEEIIIEHCSEFGYPIIFDFPAGHIEDNRPIVLGSEVYFTIDGKLKMEYKN